jgi:hypothetical protein
MTIAWGRERPFGEVAVAFGLLETETEEEADAGGEGRLVLWCSMWCPVCWIVKLSRRLLEDFVVRVGPAPPTELLQAPGPVALTDVPLARERERESERVPGRATAATDDAPGEGVSRAGPPLLAGEYGFAYADGGGG